MKNTGLRDLTLTGPIELFFSTVLYTLTCMDTHVNSEVLGWHMHVACAFYCRLRLCKWKVNPINTLDLGKEVSCNVHNAQLYICS